MLFGDTEAAFEVENKCEGLITTPGLQDWQAVLDLPLWIMPGNAFWERERENVFPMDSSSCNGSCFRMIVQKISFELGQFQFHVTTDFCMVELNLPEGKEMMLNSNE